MEISPPQNAYHDSYVRSVRLAADDVRQFDFAALAEESFAFHKTEEFGQYLTTKFSEFREHGAPHTARMMQSILASFSIGDDHRLYQAALVAGALAAIPHNNVYHNTCHFREVILLLSLVMKRHLREDMAPPLSKDQIIFLLIAAAIHDFAHDGQGNIVQGSLIPSRLEKNALKQVSPFLQAAEMTEDDLDLMRLLLICTDVSRGHEGRSPAGYCRDIFLAHEYKNISAVNVPTLFDPLVADRTLSLMATLLCEADIGISAGLSYENAKNMTRLVAQENDMLQPSANTLYGFMEVICHGGFLSQASKSLMGDNFQTILLRVQDDKDDNVLYA